MTATLILGVDPGASGAIAFFTSDGELGMVEDLPVDHIRSGKHNRSRLSEVRLLALLKNIAGAHAFLEQPTYRPMKRHNPQTGAIESTSMGVMGAGIMGESYGALRACLVASGCAITEVRPGVWGRAIGLKGGKDDARRMVCDLFPSHAATFARVKDHNRAEATLIGYYGVLALRRESEPWT